MIGYTRTQCAMFTRGVCYPYTCTVHGCTCFCWVLRKHKLCAIPQERCTVYSWGDDALYMSGKPFYKRIEYRVRSKKQHNKVLYKKGMTTYYSVPHICKIHVHGYYHTQRTYILPEWQKV